jgi:hypothetical protein
MDPEDDIAKKIQVFPMEQPTLPVIMSPTQTTQTKTKKEQQ